MLARGQLSVALALAVAACVAARPDQPAANSKKYNSVTKGGPKQVETVSPTADHSVLTFPSDDQSQSKQDVPSPINEEQNSVDDNVKPTKDLSAVDNVEPQILKNISKPVNKRFPHAVLFGGTCGGTIIHPKWVITAGHCSIGSSTLFTGGRYVLAGTNNSDDGSGVTKKVKKLYVHPLFSVGPYWLNARRFDIKQVAARYDFMLVELEEPLELNNETIAVATLHDSGAALRPGTFVGYAGYGTDHHGGYMRSDMHAMKLKIESDASCSALEQYNSEDMICAKGYAPDLDSACNGDSGSGLVNRDGKLVGVTSWVQNDAVECKNGNLVVFSRVANPLVRQWIKKHVGV